jgi:hypothetical protein
MSVDDDSDTPVIVLQNCHGDIAQLEFYDRTRPRMEETTPATVVMYVNPRPAQAVVEIPILTGGDGWEVDRAVPALQADGKYVIEAWGKRHEWSGHGTEFTLADLKGLKPGQVRHNSRPGGATPPYDDTTTEYKTTPMAEFITDECP